MPTLHGSIKKGHSGPFAFSRSSQMDRFLADQIQVGDTFVEVFIGLG